MTDTNGNGHQPTPKDLSLCAYTPCPDPWTVGGYHMCDFHAGLMEFVAWCFKHFTYGGMSAEELLVRVALPPTPPKSGLVDERGRPL